MGKAVRKQNKSTFRFPVLRKEMQLKGYTFESLANRVGIVESSLRNKMNGVSRFYLDEAKLISRLLNKDIEQLFQDEF